MRIYIVEDDISVINVLEDIIENHSLGQICGDCGGEAADIGAIIRSEPDVVLVDFFMPGMDGVEVVSEIRKTNSKIRFIMISQVSSKELIAKAYSAGIDFFISKPINIIEVKSVLSNVATTIENEKTLETIKKMFVVPPAAGAAPVQDDSYAKKLKIILSHLGMSGEKGCGDIVDICCYLHKNGLNVAHTGVSQMCEAVSTTPKNTEQRVRRAIAAGMNNIAHMGIEDFMNETFMRYSSTLFSFEDVRTEMDFIRGKSGYNGKISIKKFIDGLMLEAERY